MKKAFFWAALLASGHAIGQSLSENFDSGLPAGPAYPTHAPPGAALMLTSGAWWALNASSPLGTSGVHQGSFLFFQSFDGLASDYVAMDATSTSSGGTISTWLMSPLRTFVNGDTISFYTRKISSDAYADRLLLKLSQDDASTAPADFSVTLVSVNPTLVLGMYPVAWTQFSATISGLQGPTAGRFAFNYNVPNGGPSGANSQYIGIDAVVSTQLLVFFDGFEN